MLCKCCSDSTKTQPCVECRKAYISFLSHFRAKYWRFHGKFYVSERTDRDREQLAQWEQRLRQVFMREAQLLRNRKYRRMRARRLVGQTTKLERHSTVGPLKCSVCCKSCWGLDGHHIYSDLYFVHHGIVTQTEYRTSADIAHICRECHRSIMWVNNVFTGKYWQRIEKPLEKDRQHSDYLHLRQLIGTFVWAQFIREHPRDESEARALGKRLAEKEGNRSLFA